VAALKCSTLSHRLADGHPKLLLYWKTINRTIMVMLRDIRPQLEKVVKIQLRVGRLERLNAKPVRKENLRPERRRKRGRTERGKS
jgi:hypothetical protein